MKNVLFTLFFLCIFTFSLSAQRKEAPAFEGHQRNIYGELLGSSILIGVNYDMRLKPGRMDGIGFRAGVGGFGLNNSGTENDLRLGVVTFPLEFNHIAGKRRGGFITGVGLLPAYASISGTGEPNGDFIREEGFGVLGGFFTIGYRYQPLRNGVMFQANWNPMVLRGSGFLPGWIGLSVGYGFKK